jgi:hypothetical protein
MSIRICLFYYQAAQAISEGLVTNQELINDIPELQEMSENNALER